MASSAEEGKKTKIVLRSSDGEEFQVEEAAARQSDMISKMIDDGCTEETIPIFKVDSRTLAKIIDYCNKHAGTINDDIQSWDAAFIDVHQTILHDLLLAANFLEIKSLLDLLCKKVANMIRGKTAEEIRETFNIEKDFTQEEEEEISKLNQ